MSDVLNFKTLYSRFQTANPNLKVFLIGILLLGINNGILNSTFNNYLYDLFHINASERGLIEFPRELPGFVLIFVTGALAFMTVRGWSVLVGITASVGIFGLAFFSPSVPPMLVWMFLWSLGDHLFMPVESIVGLKLAKENKEGQRLGQISGARNLSLILGTFAVYFLMGHFHVGYKSMYVIAVISALLAAYAFSKLHFPHNGDVPKRFIIRRRYNLFYVMNILFGARKQLFLTFSPWLLISVYGTRPDTIALLLLISAGLGFVFRQYFGMAVDHFGERVVLSIDAVLLLVICLVFAYSRNVVVLYAFLIIDNLMFATRIARTTYLNKIAVEKSDLASTISLGVSMDHLVSMAIPFIGGLIWVRFGYQNLFLVASGLAVLNLVVSMRIPRSY